MCVVSRRLAIELRNLLREPLPLIQICPDEYNMLIWYFVITGPTDTDYSGGQYLGQIIFSPDYPFRAPSFKMLTPSGRFVIKQEICLTNSSMHQESWSPAWTAPMILMGFLSIMTDDTCYGVGHIQNNPAERKPLALSSAQYNHEHYPQIMKKFHSNSNL